jgi:CDP-diacylglycerol---glycerol-3-phosphate 3-phosphatidyltransferase
MLKPMTPAAGQRMTTRDRRRTVQLLNGISLLRVVMVLPVMALVLLGPTVRYAYAAAAVLFTAAAATDFLDGYLARRWRATTELGVFLDTTADKLLVSGVLIALVAVGRASPWAALVIVGREIAVLGLKAAAATSGTVVRPSIWGKLKFNVQVLAIVLAILRLPPRIGFWYLDEWIMAVAVVITVLSASQYFTRLSSVLGSGTR